MTKKVKEKSSLIKRVDACRKKLKDLQIKSPQHFFSLLNPEYSRKGLKNFNRLDNLYYSKIEDEDFTDKLEIFTLKMEQTFKK